MQDMKVKAAAEAEGIVKAARERAAEIEQEAMVHAKAKVEAEREKIAGRVREEVKIKLLKGRQEVSQRAFQDAEARILAARASPSYRNTARRLAEEALGLVRESDLVFHVDPRDRALFEGILKDLKRNCEIAPDLTSAGGLTITSRDGRFSVTNTLESRLVRARELLKGEVFTILYGD
jgi:vacuolar-type H+-ATPase subunit E/Vma4